LAAPNKLRPRIEAAADGHAKIVGWTDELPRMLHESHLLIGKAGGATVAGNDCRWLSDDHHSRLRRSGESNARLICRTNSGDRAFTSGSCQAMSTRVRRRCKNNGGMGGEHRKVSRPRPALDIAEFFIVDLMPTRRRL